MDPKFIKFPNLTISLIVICGFLYQSWLICEEYFKYATITSVTLVEALPKTNLPQVAFCTTDLIYRSVGIQETTYMDYAHSFQLQLVSRPSDGSHPGGDPRLYQCAVKRGPMAGGWKLTHVAAYPGQKPFDHFEFKEFLLRDKICFSLKTRKPWDIRPEELLQKDDDFLQCTIDLKLPLTAYKKYGLIEPKIPYNIFMTAHDSSFDDPLRSSLLVHVNSTSPGFYPHMSYTQKLLELLPPPYDTNCRDYAKEGLVTKYKCLANCLNEWTVKNHNLIFKDHMVDRKKYAIKTDVSFGNWSTFIRPLDPRFKFDPAHVVKELYQNYTEYSKNDLKMVKKYSNDPKRSSIWKNTYFTSSEYAKFLENITKIFPSLQKRLDYCNSSCSQPDCRKERIIPTMISYSTHEENTKYAQIGLNIYPPREPVTVVTSKEKIIFLDFVVYVLSCLSFWFGFCPLSITRRNYDPNRVYSRMQERYSHFKESSTRNWKLLRRQLQVTVNIRRATRVHPFIQNSRRYNSRHDDYR